MRGMGMRLATTTTRKMLEQNKTIMKIMFEFDVT
jgi:hypothetical protein